MRRRRAGLLLHPTSLPGPYGVGDLGPASRAALAWMEAASLSIWQMLPVNPVDGAGSPYASPSAFARNPLLLSVDDLVADGLLRHAEKPFLPGRLDRVHWRVLMAHRLPTLALAADRLVGQVSLDGFVAQTPWLADWALFRALTEVHGHLWTAWPEALRERDAAALARARDEHAGAIAREVALQWLFLHQWRRLREEAEARGIALWGDVPFFVGGESCDVWTHRDLFRLDAAGRPTVVSGVPPDAFSAEGQHWGTPLYDVAAHARTGHTWWCDRLESTLELFHEVRLDHFRGLAATWEIPADGVPVDGQWVPSFGGPLLDALRARLGDLPLIAEDLGVITPDVEALRDGWDLPGMAVLQFAFDDADGPGWHPFLPHNHRPRQVVYPGTHDNDTVVGWYEGCGERTRHHLRRYLSVDGRDIAGTVIRCALRSCADDAIIPLQDVLQLGSDARMNVPGEAEGNWAWRAGPGAFDLTLAARLADEVRLSGRAPLARLLAREPA